MMPGGRIDTHLHVVPPRYADWLASLGRTAGGLPIPDWSVDAALALMDSAGIETGVLSVSTPGTYLGDLGVDAGPIAAEKAREVNEFAADLAARMPDRFGFFATLCLPDVDRSIAEVAYAFDELNADGAVVLTNVDGVYLGEETWTPVFAELDRRGTAVFIHPSYLRCEPLPGIPPFVADFLLDTTRAAIAMSAAGWHERFPNLKFILSHAGGFAPYAAERIALACAPDGGSGPSRSALGHERLRRFFYDTALSSSPYALPSLLAFADPSRIIFGSDWPYATAASARHFVRLLEDFDLTDAQRRQIDRENALALFPRLG